MLGAQRDFCCAGCSAVASTIVAGGFEDYYATRSGPVSRPADCAVASVYDDPQAQDKMALIDQLQAWGEHLASGIDIL